MKKIPMAVAGSRWCAKIDFCLSVEDEIVAHGVLDLDAKDVDRVIAALARMGYVQMQVEK